MGSTSTSSVSDVELNATFRKYDADGSGGISVSEFEDLCNELGVTLEPGELDQVLQKLDKDGSGVIEKSEFVAWWSGKNDKEFGETLGDIAARGRRANHVDIHSACWDGAIDMVEEFLQQDPSLASETDDSEFGEQNTPLHYAVYNNHEDIIELLLRQPRVNINARNSAGCTPLFMAAQRGHENVVQLLLKKAARINLSDKAYGYSPIEVAATEVIKDILMSKCESAPPKPLERPPAVNCEKYGTLEVSWGYRGAEQSSGNTLAVTGYAVRVLRSEERLRSETDDSEDEYNRAGDQPLLETVLTGADKKDTIFTGVRYPFKVQAQVAVINARGQSEWSERSESIICCNVPQVTQAPNAICTGKATVKITWEKAISNGCKMKAYKLEGCEQTKDEREGGSEWIAMGVFPANVREATMDLNPGKTYTFRLVCSNALGKSKPGPASAPIKTNGMSRSSRVALDKTKASTQTKTRATMAFSRGKKK